MKQLKDFTIEQIKAELKERGYYSDNLWQESDVDTVVERYNSTHGKNIELTKDQKQDILDMTINGDGVKNDINIQLGYSFSDFIDYWGLNDDDTQE